MEELSGKWTGLIQGTNVGNLFLEIAVEGESVSGTARINDFAYGLSRFSISLRTRDPLTLDLKPIDPEEGRNITPVQVALRLEGPNQLRGDWEAEGGTKGTFVATRQLGAADASGAADEPVVDPTSIQVHAGHRNAPIPPCRVDWDVLKRVYRELSEARDGVVSIEIDAVRGSPHLIGAVGDDTEIQIQKHEVRLQALHAVGITADSVDGERFVTFDSSLLVFCPMYSLHN